MLGINLTFATVYSSLLMIIPALISRPTHKYLVSGRPKRKGASVRQEQQEPPSTTYACALKSDSDGDEENKTNPGCRRTKDWSNLQGIISDDADSD